MTSSISFFLGNLWIFPIAFLISGCSCICDMPMTNTSGRFTDCNTDNFLRAGSWKKYKNHWPSHFLVAEHLAPSRSDTHFDMVSKMLKKGSLARRKPRKEF